MHLSEVQSTRTGDRHGRALDGWALLLELIGQQLLVDFLQDLDSFQALVLIIFGLVELRVQICILIYLVDLLYLILVP